MILSRSKDCPYCGNDHSNECFIQYENGHHCFSCGQGSRKDSTHYAFRPQIEEPESNGIVLAKYTSNIKEFSTEALDWLYGNYIYETTIKKYNIVYCPPQNGKDESIILPLDKDLNQYQRRFFPKNFYSTPGVKKTLFVPGQDLGSTSLCIVEDYVSAIRVGEAMTTLCLFGTSVTNEQLDYVVSKYDSIYIWLDDDEPGINAAAKLADKLEKAYTDHYEKFSFSQAEDISIYNISTKEQPKQLSPNAILKTLRGEIV